jgi:hypothetical protein
MDEILIDESVSQKLSEVLKVQQVVSASSEPNNQAQLHNAQKNNFKHNRKRKLDGTGENEVWTTRRSLRVR